MKTFIKILCLFILCNVALSEWELRTNLDFVRQFASDGSKMYLGRNNGLTVYDLTTKLSENKTSLNSALPGNYINTLMPLPDSTILISTNGGLALIENGTIRTDKPICKDYPDNDARDLYKDSSGNIWTFSSHKVHKYSNGIWKTYDLSDSVKYAFDISRLFFHKNQVWTLFNDNTHTSTVYYFSDAIDNRFKIAVIADTGIVKLFKTIDEFPYCQGSVSLVSANEDVYLKNADGVYNYHDTTWTKTTFFNIDSSTSPYWYPDLIGDRKGNLWCTVLNNNIRISYVVSYNINTGKITEHHQTEDTSYTPIITMLDNGEILAYTYDYFFFYNDSGWVKTSVNDFGIPDSVYFGTPRIANGKKYVIISYSYNKSKNIITGTLICLDDGSTLVPVNTSFPYSTITQFGVKKDGKGMFQGRNSYTEPLQYEADSAFVKPDMVSNVSIIKPCMDGYVYYTSQRLSGPSGSTPFLTTWEGNELIKRDMGYIDEGAKIKDFDVKDNYLVALGSYVYSFDSLFTYFSSYISLYNTTDGTLLKYDRNNSCLPDFYSYQEGYIRYLMDTIPSNVTTDNNLNIWIKTSESLIKFNPTDSKIYDIPVYDSLKNNKIYFNNFHYDSNSNELIGSYATENYIFHNKIFFFDIASEKWDSINVADAGFFGNYVTHKKLLDNNVWACDDLGYLYRYVGKGKFIPFDLKLNGKQNFGFPINDFSIDANNYLHLGTDIGLLTNKDILTGVQDNETTNAENIVLMPNPATDFISLQIPQSMNVSKITNVEIFSIIGNKVIETKYKDRIDVSGLSAGVYFVKMGNKVIKFVKM